MNELKGLYRVGWETGGGPCVKGWVPEMGFGLKTLSPKDRKSGEQTQKENQR